MIFDFIEKKSIEIANFIGKNDTKDEIDVYFYAIFGIFSQIFTFGFGVIIANIFNILLEYIVTVFVFVVLRMKLGGYHCPTFKSCFIFSNICFFISIFLSISMKNFSFVFLIISSILGFCMIKVCPVKSENSPSRGNRIDEIFRRKYIIFLLFFIFINYISVVLKLEVISTSISSGVVLSVFMASHFSKKIIKKFFK